MKKIIIACLLLFILCLGVYFFFFKEETQNRPVVDGAESGLVNFTPTFYPVGLDFNHFYHDDSYPFAGSSLIDVDGDGVDEIFIGGGQGQDDALFKFNGTSFDNIITSSGLSNKTGTGGAVALDINNNGHQDLVVARMDGVYLYLNEGTGRFTESKLNVSFEVGAIPFSLTAGDINKDGLVDLYVSTFKSPKILKLATFNNPVNRSNNVMLLNKGDGVFEDITQTSGLTYNQNTFQATFVDLDNDSWLDLVVAPNTDKVVVFENKKDGTFEQKPALSEYGFWMGLAIADIDNDGDMDIFVSNVGNTIPEAAAKGDLASNQILDLKWRLYKNDGDFNFTDVTEEMALDNYEFAWGAIFADLNLDGLSDLLVSENYIKWPVHKLNKLDGRVLLQEATGQFTAVEKEAGLANPYYGTTPLVADFNGDGYSDVIWVNFNGQSNAFINQAGDNNYLKVIVPKKANTIGANIKVTRTDGVVLTKQIVAGVGLMTDLGGSYIFGLAQSEVEKVEITWPSGQVDTFSEVDINEELIVNK